MIKFNDLGKVEEVVRKALVQSIRILAVEVQARAKQNVTNVDAVDTGNMRASIYTRFHDADSRPNRLQTSGRFYSAKQRKWIVVDETKLGEPIPPPSDRFTAHVGVAAEYGMYVEFGTVRMGARPYLAPAAESVKPEVAPLTQRKIREALAKELRP